MSLVVIVKCKSGTKPLPDQVRSVPSSVNKTLNYGSIVSANNIHLSEQKFFCMSPAAEKQLCHKFREGMPVGDHPADEIEEIL